MSGLLPSTLSSLLAAIHPADESHVRAVLTGCRGAAFETVCRLALPGSSEPLWVHVDAQPGSGDERPIQVERLDGAARMLSLLAHRNDQLQTMLATVPECFKVVDRDLRLIDMNSTGLCMIGAESMPAVAGADVLDLIIEEHRGSFSDVIQRTLGGERTVQRFEIRSLLGTRRWMEQVAVALPPLDKAGESDQIAAFTREITEDLKVLQELTEARQRADAANAAKSQFLANVSHEIRTPLTAILGFADLLNDGQLKPDEAQDAIRIVQRNAEHLLAMLDDVLDLSKIEANQLLIERLPVNVQATVQQVADLFGPAASAKGLDLEVEWVGERPAWVSMDPVRLRQILMNLVGNAVKFTDAGGVRLVVEHAGDVGPDVLSVRVIDSGPGIPVGSQETIFDNFTQADASTTRCHGGTGLGLTISRRLARLLGGGLEVRSEPGQGSEFTLRLEAPLTEAPASASAAALEPTLAATASSARPLEGRRVLVAEDGRDNQRLIRLHLERAGALVTIVDDGLEALEALMGEGVLSFELVLMDIQMPRMGGLEATREIRRRGLTVPVIALTANALDEDRRDALDAGCDDFLTKPINVAALLGAAGGS